MFTPRERQPNESRASSAPSRHSRIRNEAPPARDPPERTSRLRWIRGIDQAETQSERRVRDDSRAPRDLHLTNYRLGRSKLTHTVPPAARVERCLFEPTSRIRSRGKISSLSPSLSLLAIRERVRAKAIEAGSRKRRQEKGRKRRRKETERVRGGRRAHERRRKNSIAERYTHASS